MTSTSSGRKKTLAPSKQEKVKEKQGLQDRLYEYHLMKINTAFQAAERQQMEKDQLQKLLYQVAKLEFEDKEFEVLFFKINIKRDGYVTWDEFISHLILEYQDKEIPCEFRSLDAPISKPYRLLRSHHRHPIIRITFFPTVRLDGSYDFSDGNYLTCSKDGTINYWTLDFELDRTVQSTSPMLKIQPTWVLDMVCLTDVSVVCTSSTERELRFYDTSARKFELRIMISSLEEAILCMYYEFNNDPNDDSKLIMGDMRGNVKILFFSPVGRGPFKSKPGVPLLHVRYEKLVKGLVPGFRVVEFRNHHGDWVRQVAYYKRLNGVLSCSGCSKTSLVLKDFSESKTHYVYKVPKGIWCFDFSEAGHIFATGGPDCIARIWNPFVPDKASAVFFGHHAGIVAIVLQESGKFLYSMSKDKIIKVWDVHAQTCLQTYATVPSELGEHTDFTILYNHTNRDLIVGCIMICILALRPQQSSEHTDGTTHSLGVSVILYNPLFKVIITCGLDSIFIVWDPWTGRRLGVVRNAHTRELHGETLPVEITAATFDPGNQILLTGAGDGSLKTWNFNTGTCLRNMSIESGCEVSGVVWIKGRILAIGWNRHITEFADSGGVAGPGGAFSKPWDTRHTEDVLCAAARIPQTLATSTYNGEMILWKLETGQPYKSYNVSHPTGRIKIDYKIERDSKHSKSGQQTPSTEAAKPSSVGKRMSVMKRGAPVPPSRSEGVAGALMASPITRARKMSEVQIPDECIPLRGLAVHCMIFLSYRPMGPKIATLFVAIENGSIQVWSHHPTGGFLTSFQAIHSGGDYVISMATDAKNEFLFTGSTSGYVKTWLMEGFWPAENKRVCLPKYRLLFPFTWKDTFEGRAKRANRGQPLPILLNSYKAHLMPISGMVYIDDPQILISCSADCSARMWTLGGRYLQTVGTFKPWNPVPENSPPAEDYPYQIPTDLKRFMSSTTLKVFNGGSIYRRKTKKQELAEAEKNKKQIDVTKGTVYGKKCSDPILGNYFKLPSRNPEKREIVLDTTFPYIPVYQHLEMPTPGHVPRPCTPESIQTLRYKEKTKPIYQKSSKVSIKSNISTMTKTAK